jgi:penicillin amidase
MNRETTRRAMLGAALGAGVAGGLLSPASTYLRQFAPLSGSVWGATRTGRQSTVDSPHGPAEVRYDDEGVPHVSADDERALYFAAGYVQATDRLFQMDFQRRLVRGELSAVAGDVTVDSDEFNRKMMFGDAAEATADHVRETPAGPPAEAYVDGVNAAIESESLPLEFRLLDYEPAEWTLTDSMVVEKLLAWSLTGSFRTLQKRLVADIFGDEMADDLYPDRFDERPRIIRDHHDAGTFGEGLGIDPDGSAGSGQSVERETVDWLSRFEPAPTLGSNSWLVSPALSGGEAPVVSNDPHLQLQAPPTWYEMHLDGPAHRVRGVTFPGVPFVVIGENDHGAWGFTNVGADVIDFYTYETGPEGRSYEYGDGTREFDSRSEEIEVDGGTDREIEVRRSVHGPVIEEAQQEVGVAWTGHAATETTVAIYELTHSEGVEDARAAAGKFEAPTQNLVYGSSDGDGLFQVTGRLPVRRIDGDVVRGDRVFDGSAREGEWDGFEPFERPPAWDDDTDDSANGGDRSWVPFAENPHVEDPEYLATANQLTVDDDQLAYYLGVDFDPGYRGERIYELLDRQIDAGDDLDLDFLREVGRDTRSARAATLVDGLDDGQVDGLLQAAREADDLADAADTLDAWEYRMDPESEAALLFDRWIDHYREELLADAFEEADLDEEDYSPRAGTVAQLPPDSPWFGARRRPVVMRAALRAALEEIDEEGYEVYGDISHTGQIGHPLQLDFLAYPEHPRGGSGETVQNFNHAGPWGGSWEMQVDLDGEYLSILPGGNSGRYFSDHYDDQIARWARGEYRSLSRELEGDLTVEFQEGER